MKYNFLEPIRTEGNSSELFIDGPDTLEMIIREIRNAKHFINIQVMLFYSDEAGNKIAQELAKKAEEGVQVRVMSDSELSSIVRGIEKLRSSGSSNFSQLESIFSKAGVKFISSDDESYYLKEWTEKRKKLMERKVPEEFLEMQDLVQKGINTNFNVFDHRKIFVFDGISAIMTGSNIAKKYLYDEPVKSSEDNSHKWHSGAVLIKGPFATVANKHFASKWMVRGGDVFDPEENYRSELNYGNDVCTAYSHFPGMEQNNIRDWYLRKINNCTGELIIENPYINDEKFWDELSKIDPARAKKIKIINPYKAKGNDYVQDESSIKCRMYEPLKNGISFYAYKWRMTHWKIALDVDSSEVMVGSYNLNYRSALHDFEMNVLIESKNLSSQVREMLLQDMEQSELITEAGEFFKHPKLHARCLLLDTIEYFE